MIDNMAFIGAGLLVVGLAVSVLAGVAEQRRWPLTKIFYLAPFLVFCGVSLVAVDMSASQVDELQDAFLRLLGFGLVMGCSLVVAAVLVWLGHKTGWRVSKRTTIL
ncbi:hypothetical protein KYE_16608 [Marinobacter manganoxydans MnI7-9]|uniref:Uncharacterized protein n=1 Tax=Marinobacter manganoxydans MnI7-9 TaxID=1094979 RepID=G6YWQ8_9GAMM|nr:hypothetical protein KYE_16608 [Marinobacter manganoxydans MnI7-9]